MLELFLGYYEINFIDSIFLLFCPFWEGHDYILN